MQQFAEPVTDKQGNVLVGAQVTVYTTDGSLATLYAADEVTVISNPVITDALGMCVFKAQNGNYRRTVTFSGVAYPVAGDISLDTPIPLAQTKYRDGAPVLLFPARTSGSGSRNVIQGHAFDVPNKQWYALQLNDSSNTFYIRKLKFGSPRIPANVTEINPSTALIVHQGLFYTDVSGARYLWVGGDAGSPVQVVRVTESTGAVTLFPFNPNLTPGATGTWSGNVTCNLNLAGTKLFVRLGNGTGDFILRYDWAAFQANSATLAAEALFPVAVEQYAGTSFQGIAADEDTIYVMSGNTTQTLNKLLYAYDFQGNIRWKRQMAPHYFDSFFNGTKCEVEGLSIMTLPTGQRILTLVVEMGTSGHNVHRMYGIPQYLQESAFGNATAGLFVNDYDAIGIGAVPPSDGDVMFQLVDPTPLVGGLAQTTRFGVRNTACVGPTGGGVQMNVGTDGAAYINQREAMPLYVYTNNQQRMVLAADRSRADIGLGETGPQTGNISPGYRLGLNIGALSTNDTATVEQEIMRLSWTEGSQDIGAGEGIYTSYGIALSGAAYAPVMNFGISKVTGSDSTTNSNGFIAMSPGTGQAPVKYFNFNSNGSITPLSDAVQNFGAPGLSWAAGYFAALVVDGRRIAANHLLYQSAAPVSYVAVATTFTPVTYITNAGKVQLSSAGVHGLTSGVAVGKSVYVTWAGGTGVNGFYNVLSVETTLAFTIDLTYAAGLGTPSATVAGVESPVMKTLCTVPANAIGNNGILEIEVLYSMANTANSKTPRLKVGGTIVRAIPGTSVSLSQDVVLLRNRGLANSQVATNTTQGSGYNSSTSAVLLANIDTTAAQDITFTAQPTAANEPVTLEGARVVIRRGLS